MPYKHPLYVEYNDQHFKLHAPKYESKEYIQIYANIKGRPIIFDHLFKKYQEAGMTDLGAATKARDVVKEFFTACDELSKLKKYAFKIRVTPLSPNLLPPHVSQFGPKLEGATSENLDPIPLRDGMNSKEDEQPERVNESVVNVLENEPHVGTNEGGSAEGGVWHDGNVGKRTKRKKASIGNVGKKQRLKKGTNLDDGAKS